MKTRCTAFQGKSHLASGESAEVAVAAKAALTGYPDRPILIFDDATGRQIDFDLRGTDAEILARFADTGDMEQPPRGPGRPRLGVVAREITLLPRHWEWLNEQPGGASVALRRLVENARTANAAADRVRLAQRAADSFMAVMAGNEPGYEEASRALYAGDAVRFEAETAAWPRDIREHARWLARAGLESQVTAA